MQKFKKLKTNMVLNGESLIKAFIIPVFLIFAFTAKAAAQSDQGHVITVNITASEILPADLIVFNININAEAATPQEAFDTHKKRETVLAELLKEFEIDEKDIQYDPIRINKQYRDESKTTVTSQSVSVTFSDFSMYEQIQVTLIDNGFDSFNGRFTSSEIEQGKEKALVKAIEAAKEKAEVIAEASGVKLGEIQKIQYADHEVGIAYNEMRVSAYAKDDSMMDFPQTVTVTENINVSFRIE